MANDFSLGQALAYVAGGVSISVSLCACFGRGRRWLRVQALRGVTTPLGYACARCTGQLGRGWRWLRVQALGGVTTLEHPLGYACARCRYSLDAHEKVRTLSCGHVFHYRESDNKCKQAIDQWFYETSVTCLVCNQTALPVWPWKARPPLSPPAPATASSSALASASSPLEQSSSSGGSSDSLLPLSTPVLE